MSSETGSIARDVQDRAVAEAQVGGWRLGVEEVEAVAVAVAVAVAADFV